MGCGHGSSNPTTHALEPRGCSSDKATEALEPVVFKDIFVDKKIEEPKLVDTASPNYSNRTPGEEKKYIESVESAQILKRGGLPLPPHADERKQLLDGMQNGTLNMYDPSQVEIDPETKRPKLHSSGNYGKSVATGGLPSSEHGPDFAVASAPGDNFLLYSFAVYLCAKFGIGLAVVFEAHWGEIWFAVWKRNVDALVAAKKILIVLTKYRGHGSVGFAQTVEIMYLREQGYSFVAMNINAFCCALFPWSNLAKTECDEEHDKFITRQLASSRRQWLVHATDAFGRTAMHYCQTAEGAKMLHAAGGDINAKSWVSSFSNTPLMHHAMYGRVEAVCGLLALRANVTTKDTYDRTAFDMAAQTFRQRKTPGCEEIMGLLSP